MDNPNDFRWSDLHNISEFASSLDRITGQEKTTTPISNADYMNFLNFATPNEKQQQEKDYVDENSGDGNNGGDSSGDKRRFNSVSDESNGKFQFESLIGTEQLDFMLQPPQIQDGAANMHIGRHHGSISSNNGNANGRISSTNSNNVEFTPLLSPMINPSLERVNSNKGKSGFSPLSSPVLEFQKYNNTSTLRQKRKDLNDSASKDKDYEMKTNETMSDKQMERERASKRSKTPISTPLLSTMDSRKSISNAAKNGAASATASPYQTYVFKPQSFPNSKESSVSTASTNNTSRSFKTFSNNEFSDNSFVDAFDGDLTLPPPPNGNHDIDDFAIPAPIYQSSKANTTDSSGASTIMSLSSTPNLYPKRNSVLINPNHHKSAQSSPVILPSSNSTLLLESQKKYEFKIPVSANENSATPSTKRNSSHSTPIFKYSNPQVSKNKPMPPVGTSILSSNRPMSMINTNNNSNNNNSDNLPNTQNTQSVPNTPSLGHGDKKMSHKLAEQGRRNRMNIAIQELDKLIPESMKEGITVPSKATTVELGCRYIEELLTRLESNKSNTNEPNNEPTKNDTNNNNNIHNKNNDSMELNVDQMDMNIDMNMNMDMLLNMHHNENNVASSGIESISPLDTHDIK